MNSKREVALRATPLKKCDTYSTVHQLKLETERLALRGYDLDDAERVAELVGNYEVAKTTQNIPHPYSLEMAKNWISSHAQSLNEGDRIAYAILVKGPRELVGTVSLIDIQECQASLGYWIGQPYWGKGYCTEAVSAILDYAFAELRIESVYADHYSNNPASGKVMVKNGMQYIGQRDAIDRNGNIVKINRYEIFNT